MVALVVILSLGVLTLPVAFAIPGYNQYLTASAELDFIEAESGKLVFAEEFKGFDTSFFNRYNTFGLKKPESKLNVAFSVTADMLFADIANRTATAAGIK